MESSAGASLPFPARPAPPPPPSPQAAVPAAPFPPVTPAAAARGDVPASQPADLEGIVRLAFEGGFSDVHLGVGEQPRYRNRGDILPTGWPVTDAVSFRKWLGVVLGPADLDRFLTEKEYDGAHAFPFVRVRVNLLDTVRGPAMVLRLIPNTIPSLEELGMPEVVKRLAARPKGLFLITGPTGAGKTTTLAALVEHINQTMFRHILTIEDPVEYLHQSRNSLIRQREVGSNTRVFAGALRAALREDPDVIQIGEIRDQETLAIAIEAAQTGHLVLATLHTNSAVRSVERVLGMVPPQDQHSIRRALSESLVAVVSQGLIKTRDGRRTSFQDILINTDACRDYILRGELDAIEEIMARSAFDGMITGNQSLAELVRQGRVWDEDALAQSLRPNELIQVLRGRTS